jgi:hypothetical protein
MKKIILTVAAVFVLSFANAQDGGFKVGINAGLPMGDIKDSYSLSVGLDIAYLKSFSDKFQAGLTTGYAHYLGKSETLDLGFGLSTTYDFEDGGFIPLAATAQYSVSDNIFLGGDLGYAIGVSPSENKGGFLYQPKVGYQTEKFELYAGYKGISVDGGTFSSVNLGFNYKF